jgi:hypothetical protein
MPPPRPSNGQVVAGGVLAFVGFLLLGIGAFLSRLMPYEFGGIVYGTGYILAGVGILLAFLGLARRA